MNTGFRYNSSTGWLVVIGVLLACLFQTGCQQERNAGSPNTDSPPSATDGSTNVQPPLGVTEEDLKAFAKVYGGETRETYAKRHAEQIKKDHMFEDRHPINFWGQVVDQNGTPLPGIVVNPYWNDYINHKPANFKVTTDANGRFKVLGGMGKEFYVALDANKEYFYTVETTRAFDYGTAGPERFIPDPTNPVKIVVWQPTMPAQVFERGTRGQMPVDGTWVGLDLLSVMFNTNGPFFLRAKALQPGNLEETEVQMDLHLAGGGLVSTQEEYAWHPPADGWSHSVRTVIPRSFSRSNSLFGLSFYCKLQDPPWYGRIRFIPEELPYTNQPNTGFTIHYHINTNAVRVVEHFVYRQLFLLFPSATGGWQKGVLRGDPPGYEEP